MTTAPQVVDFAQRITRLFEEAGLSVVERVAVLRIAEALLPLAAASFSADPIFAPPAAAPPPAAP